MLDLDATALGSLLDALTAWAAQHGPVRVHTVADIGAGTGTGTLALARRYPDAELVAIDRSETMLDRVRAATSGLNGRVRTVRADLDVAWPEVAAVDLAWAALSLHEVTDPHRVLADIHSALNPGGVLVVIEMDGFPRFLPDDIGFGRHGLEARCHRGLTALGWNHRPDWRLHLERAGFGVVEQRTFTTSEPSSAHTVRYAGVFLRRVRRALTEVLDADDLAALDRVLGDGPDSLAQRDDLTVSGSRTAWAARV